MPMPASRARASASRSDESDGEEPARKRGRDGKKHNKPKNDEAARQPAQQPKVQVQTPRAPKGGVKGKGQMPRALVGGVSRMADDHPICYGYNLGQCKAVKPGERCPRGYHVCTKLGCGGKHPASECIM